MIKLEIVDGSLQVSNGGSVILVAPKNSCAIDVLALYDETPFIVIYNKYLGNSTNIFNQPLADCEDSTGTPFTVNTFIDFAEANLGFDGSVVGGCSPFKYNVNSSGIEPCLGSNNACGAYATIGGGQSNTAYGSKSTIGGGDANIASSSYGTIGGGAINTTSSAYSTVGGGSSNIASSAYSTVGGGALNTASSVYSTIGGGKINVASGCCSVVAGGYCNVASGLLSTIGGGQVNTAFGSKSTVGGGGSNTGSGECSVVGGGYRNTASNTFSTISGGYCNVASGGYSVVGGGYRNTASNTFSTISGGYCNIASSYYSTVGGGQSNTASGTRSTVSGGLSNTASGCCSTVGGGYNNIASGYYSSVFGGRYNNTNNYNTAMIIGSEITANRACTTFVNDLNVCSMANGSNGCSVKVDENGLFVSCNLSGSLHTFTKPSVGSSTVMSINGTTMGTIAGIANKLTVIPYIPSQTITSASLYINVTTAIASSLARILIYSNLDGKPDIKIYESANLDCSTTGVKTATTVQTFEAGQIYWIGVQVSSTQTLSGNVVAQLTPLNINGIIYTTSFTISPAFGSAPSPFGTPTNQNLSVPFVGITL